MFDSLLNLDQHDLSGYINSKLVVPAVSNAMKKIDHRLVDHGARVAYIALEMCREGKLGLDEDKLFLLSLFHDIGAYRTEEIDHMVEFETGNVYAHSVYGYLFFKYFTPLKDYSEAILYHHSAWDKIKNTKHAAYAALIYLSDRYDIALHTGQKYFDTLIADKQHNFCSSCVDLLQATIANRNLAERVLDGSYIKNYDACLKKLVIDNQSALQYIRMLVYSLDFRSQTSVTHTAGTIAFTISLAQRLKMNNMVSLYLGALLHDCGKAGIPFSIVEKPGRLNDDEMKIMRTHVNITEELCRGVVCDEVLQLAVRHHEKLDGSGYPHGLAADELTQGQRVLAIADILSALCSKRSYKEPFSKEKVLEILSEMAEHHIDPQVVALIKNEYDDILAEVNEMLMPITARYEQMKAEYDRLITMVSR